MPDAAYWAPGVEMSFYPVHPPTLAVEVRSPSQSVTEQREECRYYVDNGVSVAWLVDPDSRTVEIFDGQLETVARVGDSITSTALPGFALDVANLFAMLDD